MLWSWLRRLRALGAWLIRLFDPPPLESLSFAQKVGRVVVLTLTFVIGSILLAMFGALALFFMEASRRMGEWPQFYHGLAIVLAGAAVNIGCVFILVQIKRADTRLVPPRR